jgi:hypothetical protein
VYVLFSTYSIMYGERRVPSIATANEVLVYRFRLEGGLTMLPRGM